MNRPDDGGGVDDIVDDVDAEADDMTDADEDEEEDADAESEVAVDDARICFMPSSSFSSPRPPALPFLPSPFLLPSPMLSLSSLALLAIIRCEW